MFRWVAVKRGRLNRDLMCSATWQQSHVVSFAMALLTVALLAGTVMGSCRSGMVAPQPWSLSRAIDAGASAVTLFAWDHSSVALVRQTPAGATIDVHTTAGSAVGAWTASIRSGLTLTSAGIRPDVFARNNKTGEIVWLAKLSGELRYLTAVGTLTRTVKIDCEVPAYMALGDGDLVDVFCADARQRRARFMSYDSQGRLVSETPGWIEDVGPAAGDTASAFFRRGTAAAGEPLVELLFGFPDARMTSGERTETWTDPCLKQLPAVGTRLESNARQFGLPVPLGGGRTIRADSEPYTLGLAVAPDGSSFALRNGSAVTQIRPDGRPEACWLIPPPTGSDRAHSHVFALSAGIHWISLLRAVHEPRMHYWLETWTRSNTSSVKHARSEGYTP